MSDSSLLAQWDSIHAEGDEIDAYMRLRVPEVRACRVYAARRVPEGLEAIILEVDKSAIPASAIYPETQGLTVHVNPLSPGRSGDARLVLELGHTRYRDVFRSLGVDLVRALETASSPREAIDVFISRLTRWQTFLREQGAGGLSAERVRGLFGELAFLRGYGISKCGASRVIRAWRGPFRASHDFQFSGGSVEVKTTSAVSPARFRVSNVQQLDDTNVSRLVLCLVLIQESESEGESLVELVEAVRGNLGEADHSTFDDALLAAGFLEAHRQLYDSPRFVCREYRFYDVNRGFPRLRESDLPEGVVNIRYDVETGACVPYRLSADAVLSELLEFGEHNG
jgi:hypothetical protein